MTEAVAAEDVAFLAQLRDLVTERQAALPAVVGMGSAPERDPLRRAQEDMRAQWDFYGSVVIGRADTAEGQRYYIGTRSVVTPDDHVVVVAQDSALGRAVWKDTSVVSPARTALKRHLQVTGWTLTRSQTEFDLRDGGPDAPPAGPDAASGDAAPGATATSGGVAGPGESGERNQPPAGPAAAMPAPPTGAPVAGGLATPPDGSVPGSPASGPTAPGQSAPGEAAAEAGDAPVAVPAPTGGAEPDAVPGGEPGTAAPVAVAAVAAAAAGAAGGAGIASAGAPVDGDVAEGDRAAAGGVAGADGPPAGDPSPEGPSPQGAAPTGAADEESAAQASSPEGGAGAADSPAAVDLAALDQARTGAAQALRDALARVESGAGGAAGALAAVAAWDTAIADAAAALELPEDGATLEHVSAELTRREEERKAAERAALDERIEVVQRWLDGGGPGADEARAFLDQLTRLREQP